jgi:hypothetical protein
MAQRFLRKKRGGLCLAIVNRYSKRLLLPDPITPGRLLRMLRRSAWHLRGGSRVGLCAVILLGILAISSCWTAECQMGEVRCEGGSAMSCLNEVDYGLRWSTEHCDHQCVTAMNSSGKVEALCTLSSALDVRCIDGDGATCAQDRLVACRNGYATAETTCATSCIALDGHEDYCRGSKTASPQCASEADGSGCEAVNNAFTGTQRRAPGGLCGSEGSGFGPVSSMPDEQIYSFKCEQGLLVQRTLCPSRYCVERSDCSTACQ